MHAYRVVFIPATMVAVMVWTPHSMLTVWGYRDTLFTILDVSPLTSHLPPPPSLEVQYPCITQDLALILPSSDQQLGVVPTVPKTRSSMVPSPHRPGFSLSFVQFTPVLQ